MMDSVPPVRVLVPPKISELVPAPKSMVEVAAERERAHAFGKASRIERAAVERHGCAPS